MREERKLYLSTRAFVIIFYNFQIIVSGGKVVQMLGYMRKQIYHSCRNYKSHLSEACCSKKWQLLLLFLPSFLRKALCLFHSHLLTLASLSAPQPPGLALHGCRRQCERKQINTGPLQPGVCGVYLTPGNLFPMISMPLGIQWLIFLKSSEIVRIALRVEGAQPRG